MVTIFITRRIHIDELPIFILEVYKNKECVYDSLHEIEAVEGLLIGMVLEETTGAFPRSAYRYDLIQECGEALMVQIARQRAGIKTDMLREIELMIQISTEQRKKSLKNGLVYHKT